MQNNQLPTKSHVELGNYFNVLTTTVDYVNLSLLVLLAFSIDEHNQFEVPWSILISL